jgi:hypothetical protein
LTVEDLDAGDLPGNVWISDYLNLQAAQWNLKIGRESGLVPVPAREEVFLGHIPLILSDIHVVKLGSIGGLYLDLLGHLPAGADPMTFEICQRLY